MSRAIEQFILCELSGDNLFDPNTLSDHVSFTQAKFYGDWQKALGRVVRRFIIKNKNEIVAYFQLIKYPLLFNKSYYYSPYGPVIKESLFSQELLLFIKNKLVAVAVADGAVFSRLDFTPIIKDRVLLQKLFSLSLLCTYHSAYFQPRYEWVLKLDKSEDEILATMHEKTRYSIRLATRREVKVEIITDKFINYFDEFYSLMIETAKRNSFCLHKKEYYKIIFNSLPHINNSFLSIARYKNEILSINLIIIFGNTANYIFGGSSNNNRNCVPTYLAQWESICHAKKLGCLYYNFGGISEENDNYKSWEGLTIFKKKFGGFKLQHSDFYDVVIHKLWYWAYNLRKLMWGKY